MNERIKKLMIQASDTFYDDEGPYKQLNPEKFAELIVKECGKLLSQPEYIGRSDLDWSMILNEHFGVK